MKRKYKAGEKVYCKVLSWNYPKIYEYKVGTVYEMEVSNDADLEDIEFSGPYGGSFDTITDTCRVEVIKSEKFKVGDKVRVKPHGHGKNGFKPGDILVVSGVNDQKDFGYGSQHITTEVDSVGSKSNGWHSGFFELVEASPSSTKILTLPTDSEARKQIPIFSGCVKYFPAAIAGIARISKAGNDKHNPGQELHHDRNKSLDHSDCILRHLMDVADAIAALERGENTNPEMILAEVSSLAWRALAYSQALHEKYDGAPMAPGAKLKGDKNGT